MARLRTTRAVRVLTFEEKTRVANFFMLLIEVNFQTEVTNKRRSPQSTKNKKMQPCCNQKAKHRPTSPRLRRPGRPIKRCYNTCPALRNSSRTAQRDLFLYAFARILIGSAITFIMGYSNDRHHRFTAHTRFV